MNDFSAELQVEAANVAALEPQDIGSDDRLLDDLGLDSIMLLDLLATMARKYPALAQITPADVSIGDNSTFGELERTFLSIVGTHEEAVSVTPRSSVVKLPAVAEFLDYYERNATVARDTYMLPHENIAGRTIVLEGREMLNFSSYNYMGTNGHPDVVEAVADAAATYGTSVSASRLISGEIPPHGALERAIADHLGVEDALVMVSGHATNVNLLGNILGDGDLILHDALAHNSIVQGAEMSAARRRPFKHNDPDTLRRELDRLRGRFDNVLVVVEGVYSMDGDICMLPEILAACEDHGALLMIDEAHSFGTIGRGGAGVCSYFGIDPTRVAILMGTLSKSLNSCGGYIAGNADFITYLRYNQPGFVFSAGITPPNTVAALESLNLLRTHPEWVDELDEIAGRLRNGLRMVGADIGMSSNTPIVPVILGDSQRAIAAARILADSGINVDPITYPAVKDAEARLRFFVSRMHTAEDIDRTVEAMRGVLA